MLIHHSLFERVTAMTDIFMGLLAAYAASQLAQFSGFKSDVWAWTFGLLAFSSFLGAVAHGFEMTQKTNDRLWMPINLSLGLALGLFVVGALFDLGGEALARKSMPLMLVVGFGFFLVTVWKPGTSPTKPSQCCSHLALMFTCCSRVLFQAQAGWWLEFLSLSLRRLFKPRVRLARQSFGISITTEFFI